MNFPKKALPADFIFNEDVKTGCWNWEGSIRSNGYANYWYKGRGTTASRAIYEMLFGDQPKGIDVDHTCRNRKCVNPDHLRAITHRENVLISSSPPALNAAKTECVHGHPFSVENTANFRSAPNRRYCRECQRLNNRRASKIRREATAARRANRTKA